MKGRRYRQRQCRHLDALGIYADGINIMGGRRGFCPDCRLVLDSLPLRVVTTGDQPTPCIPDRRGGLVADPFWLALTREDDQ